MKYKLYAVQPCVEMKYILYAVQAVQYKVIQVYVDRQGLIVQDIYAGTCTYISYTSHSLSSVVAGAGISEKVGSKPVGVEVLGQKLVLFRGSDGTVHCLHGALLACPSLCTARAQQAACRECGRAWLHGRVFTAGCFRLRA